MGLGRLVSQNPDQDQRVDRSPDQSQGGVLVKLGDLFPEEAVIHRYIIFLTTRSDMGH